MPIISAAPAVFYLHNNVFPPQLEPEEESACIKAMAAGDEEARARLI